MLNIDVCKAVLRFKWDSPELDPKAVGGHLPLSKRNSTPAFGLDFGVPPPPFNRKSAVMPPQQTQIATQPNPTAPILHAQHESAASQHRRLDRSQSDPLRQEQPSPPASIAAAASATSSRYKTELCRPFAETGFCKYGDKCQFAHGGGELRSMPRHPKYKTERCRTFHTVGICAYGTRCHFIHNSEERRGPSASSNHSSTASTSSSPLGAMTPSPTLATPPETGLPFMQTATLATDEHPSSILTPPHSLNGSPTSPAGTFFNGALNIITQKNMLDAAAGPGLEPMVPPHPDLFGDAYSLSLVSMPRDTPPGSPPQSGGESSYSSSSPVESLVGDVDNLALVSDVSPPPAPNRASPHFDNGKYLRLPIFETLTEF